MKTPFGTMMGLRGLSLLVVAMALSACAAGHHAPVRPDVLAHIQPSKGPVRYARLNAGDALIHPRRHARPAANLPKPLLAEIVVPRRPLQCVPYARELSHIEIRGNAWTWWDQAEGRYPRGSHPHKGSVMVLKKKNTSSLGHVAYVEEVVDSRTVLVSHANWLNKGRVHKHMPVIDISKNNDWSAVRFWNGDGGHFGGNIYHPYGFVHPNLAVASR
ncbi:MAG: CHAP domain-containing protein [Alphaproteobacteria bacterium]